MSATLAMTMQRDETFDPWSLLDLEGTLSSDAIHDPRLKSFLSVAFRQTDTSCWNGFAVIEAACVSVSGTPSRVSVQEGRYLALSGCIPRFGRKRGLLWLDCGSSSPSGAFASLQKEDPGAAALTLYISGDASTHEVSPHFLVAVRQWLLAGGTSSVSEAIVLAARGNLWRIDPRVLGHPGHHASRTQALSVRRPRILIFTHDGRGLGHLRRLSRLGSALGHDASVLYITGHREAAWLVPPGCEYVHLPNRDNLDARRSRQWGRQPFLPGGTAMGARLRHEIIRATIEVYKPDALIMDYLPLGIDEEMKEFVFSLPGCRKYFVSRGILGSPERVYQEVLTPSSLEALRSHYHLLLVMSDYKIVDSVSEYGLEPQIADKLVYTGYAAEKIEAGRSDRARKERGLAAGAKWVVCSAGGGKEGEALIERCWEIANIFPECYFDIVIGPRSRLAMESESWIDGRRIRLIQVEGGHLPVLHASADIVICRGGYNSLMEAFVGTATIIVAPIATDYEQVNHARRLSKYRDIIIVDDLADLDLQLEQTLARSAANLPGTEEIDLDGLATASSLILSDLSFHMQAFSNDEARGL